MELFPDEKSARAFFEDRRWANGAICPSCNSGNVTRLKRVGYHRCRECKVDFTVKTGTPMACSNIPLKKWLYAMYLMTTARKGISSLQLSKDDERARKAKSVLTVARMGRL